LWTHTVNVGGLNILQPLQLVCDTKDDPNYNPPPSPQPSAVVSNGIRYNAKVLLSTSYPYTNLLAITDIHLSKAIKFLVSKDRDGIFAIGGPCEPERDGPDPSQDQALINAAKRHVYEETHIDLSPVESWVRFLEVWYQRDDYQEVTVVLLPDLSEIAPTLEQAIAQWQQRQTEAGVTNEPEKAPKAENVEMTEEEKAKKEQEEKESPLEPPKDEMEDEPYDEDEGGEKKKKEEDKGEKKKEEPPREPNFLAELHKTPDSKRKLMVISLDGLLDYDETDKLEASFELSLFAESFHLMLQVQYLPFKFYFLFFKSQLISALTA
jgi:hypothetical protein